MRHASQPSLRYAPCILTGSPDRAKREHKSRLCNLLRVISFGGERETSRPWVSDCSVTGVKPAGRSEPCPEPLAEGGGCAAFAARLLQVLKRQHKTDTKIAETRGASNPLNIEHQEKLEDTSGILFRIHWNVELILASFESSTSTTPQAKLTGPRTSQKPENKNERKSSRIVFIIQSNLGEFFNPATTTARSPTCEAGRPIQI